MTFVRESVATVTTNASSAGEGYTGSLNGLLHSIHYTKASTASALSTTAVLAVTGETSGVRYLDHALTSSSDLTFMPRGPVHNSSAGSTNAGGDKLPICNERVKVSISAGGATKTGTFRVTVA